jgi:hypothetical protein
MRIPALCRRHLLDLLDGEILALRFVRLEALDGICRIGR